jgi:catechol 2,3-dioxygenase-like lactoylglutathione lyase family enzyme
MATRTATGVTRGGATLTTSEAVATLGVKDLGAARRFYEEKLGLEPEDVREHDVVTYTSGGSKVFVYKSDFAGTNKATALTWVVADVDAVVKDLNKKGVPFEHYEMPGTTLEGDVSRRGHDARRLVQGPRRQHPRRRQRGLEPSKTHRSPA